MDILSFVCTCSIGSYLSMLKHQSVSSLCHTSAVTLFFPLPLSFSIFPHLSLFSYVSFHCSFIFLSSCVCERSGFVYLFSAHVSSLKSYVVVKVKKSVKKTVVHMLHRGRSALSLSFAKGGLSADLHQEGPPGISTVVGRLGEKIW